MSKPATLEVVEPAPQIAIAPAANLKELGTEIVTTYGLARSHAQLAIVFAVRTGVLCERAKAALDHGQFEPWLETIGLPKQTAHRYRALAKSPTGGTFDAEALAAPDFIDRIEQDSAFRDEWTQRTRESVGESSLTEVFRSEGIVKPPANIDADTGKRKHYPAKKVSADEAAKAARKAAQQAIRASLANVSNLLIRAKAYRHLTPAEIGHFDEQLADISKRFHVIALRTAETAKTAKPTKKGAHA